MQKKNAVGLFHSNNKILEDDLNTISKGCLVGGLNLFDVVDDGTATQRVRVSLIVTSCITSLVVRWSES